MTMKERINKIKASAKRNLPWIIAGAGAAFVLTSSHKKKQTTKKVDAQIDAKIAESGLGDDASILVLAEVPPNEGRDVYQDLDNPGMYYEVKAL